MITKLINQKFNLTCQFFLDLKKEDIDNGTTTVEDLGVDKSYPTMFTTSTSTSVTSKIHTPIPVKYLDCQALFFNFTKVSNIGDGICHDYLNHVYCHYDGGDCCLENVNTSVCSTCACFDDDSCKSFSLELFAVDYLSWFEF